MTNRTSHMRKAFNNILNLENTNRFADDFFDYFTNWQNKTPSINDLHQFHQESKPMCGWTTKQGKPFKFTPTIMKKIQSIIIFAKETKCNIPN